MKKYLLPAAFLLTFYWPMACTNNETTGGAADSLSTSATTTTVASTSPGAHRLSESETYSDLNTGKTFKVRMDTKTGRYVADNGVDLMYYLNPVTHDTFYGPEGRWVNGALNYNPGTGYSIDESRIQVNPSSPEEDTEMMGIGGTDKVKSNENEFKAKSNDGEDKVKANENEAKMKENSGSKIKTNEHETKIKQKTH